MRAWAAALVVSLAVAPAYAQNATTKTDCSVSSNFQTGRGNPPTQDATGAGCVAAKPVPSVSVATSSATVGTSSVSLASAGTMTRGWRVMNTTTIGSAYIDLCWGATCTLGAGFARVYPGASDDWKGVVPPAGSALSAIASAPGQTVTVTVSN